MVKFEGFAHRTLVGCVLYSMYPVFFVNYQNSFAASSSPHHDFFATSSFFYYCDMFKCGTCKVAQLILMLNSFLYSFVQWLSDDQLFFISHWTLFQLSLHSVSFSTELFSFATSSPCCHNYLLLPIRAVATHLLLPFLFVATLLLLPLLLCRNSFATSSTAHCNLFATSSSLIEVHQTCFNLIHHKCAFPSGCT